MVVDVDNVTHVILRCCPCVGCIGPFLEYQAKSFWHYPGLDSWGTLPEVVAGRRECLELLHLELGEVGENGNVTELFTFVFQLLKQCESLINIREFHSDRNLSPISILLQPTQSLVVNQVRLEINAFKEPC